MAVASLQHRVKKTFIEPSRRPSVAFLAYHAACVTLVNKSPILHGDPMALELTPLISDYGIWLVAGFILLESLGIPLPAEAALMALNALVVERYPHGTLARVAWGLRHNFSYYDALYVALAARLEVPLITSDERLSTAPGLPCLVELI